MWHLTTRTPIGDPLTGHHRRGGRGCSALVLPDGTPIAVTASDDATVWI